MLDPFSRGILCALTAFCILGIFTLSPLRARGSSDLQRSILRSQGVVLPAAGEPGLDIVRNPFAGEVANSEHRQLAPVISIPHADTSALPANLPDGMIPSLPQDVPHPALRVTAIVTGSHPYAMLDMAGDHQIKGIGDRVDGRPIVAIDFDGVTLQGGQRLSVATEGGTR